MNKYKLVFSVFIIAFAIILTLSLVKFLPPIFKLIMLTADVVIIYFAVDFYKTTKNKNNSKNNNSKNN